MSSYVSQIVLIPQQADWRWYKTLCPYLERYRVTVTQSADDAGSFHGRDHTVTILESPQLVAALRHSSRRITAGQTRLHPFSR
jgi:hypothetical protein